MKKTGLSKLKLFAKDSAWSIAALCLMNAVLQFLLYPILRQVLGQDGFGEVQYLLGIISIIAVTIGSSVNYAHIVSSTRGGVLGSEGEGVSPLTKRSCDKIVSIPLYGKVNSFNVSAAAAILFAEVAKAHHPKS